MGMISIVLKLKLEGWKTRPLKVQTQEKKNRYAALFAVLDEQKRQLENYGITVDPEYIAKLYRQSSAHCQMKAIQIAANDARLFSGDVEMSFYASKINSKTMLPPASPTPIRSTLACSITSPHKTISRRQLLTIM